MFRKQILSGLGESIPTTVDVYLIFGQSGARGNTGGVAPPSPYDTPNSKGYIIGRDNSTNGNAPFEVSSFQVMDYITGNLLGMEHGVEVSIAYSYNNKPVYFVKVVHGGTNLAVNWASGSVLRNYAISFTNTAKEFFSTNNIDVNWRWVWNQWEADSVSTTYSNNYEANYQGLISEFIASTNISLSSHIIIGVNTNSDYYTDKPSNCDTIITAQQNNADLYNGVIVNQSDLTLHDGVHCTSEGYITLGERIKSAI